MEIDFYDHKTKKIHEKLSSKDNYNQFITELFKIPFDYGDNDIPENARFSLSSFTAIELYSRANKESLSRAFQNFIKLSEKRKDKYSKLNDDAKKTVKELHEDVDYSYSSWLTDYKLIINKKHIDYIMLNLKSIGPSLVRITYTISLTDYARYKYWLLSTPNVKRELRIKTKYRYLQKNYSFSRRTGNGKKVYELEKLEKCICTEIDKVIKKISPGILCTLYKQVPITMNAILYFIPSLTITPSYVLQSTFKHSNFLQNIYNIAGKNSTPYIDDENESIFLPPANKRNINDRIYMKHFIGNAKSVSVDDISWICIMHSLLHDQTILYQKIRNIYHDKGVSGKKTDFIKLRKEINAIDSVWSLINSSFQEDKRFYESDEIKHSNYCANFGTTTLSLITNYIKSIDDKLLKIKETLPEIKNVYNERYIDENSRVNTRLQIIAVILALFTISQTVYQCGLSDERNKDGDSPKQNTYQNICHL